MLEFASREMSEVDLVGKYASDGRELGAGVMDVKGFSRETPEDVATRIQQALKVCPAEKL